MSDSRFSAVAVENCLSFDLDSHRDCMSWNRLLKRENELETYVFVNHRNGGTYYC